MSQLVIPQNPTPLASVYQGFAITPSDTVALAKATTRLWIGVTGNLTVIFNGDTAPVTLSNLPVGLYEFSVAYVHATGTTATGIVGLI